MQVWCEGKHVGDLRVDVAPHMRTIVLRTADIIDWDIPVGDSSTRSFRDPVFSTIELPIDRRETRVDQFALESSRMSEDQFIRANRLPVGDPTLVKNVYMEDHTIGYTWKVAVVTPALLNDIFDMDMFEPC